MKNTLRAFALMTGLFCMSTHAQAAIQTESVEYTSADNTIMEGFVAYDDAVKSPRPGIIIVPDWMGLGDFAKEKAVKLAKQGYTAFAADVYGKGVRPKNTDEAGKLATHYKNDRALLRSHIQAAYDTLTGTEKYHTKGVVVMGYCFGGTTALELARGGASLLGTVSFHGGLSNPTPANAKNITGKVLVMHGADDPMVPPAEVEAFKEEMKDTDMKFVAYPGAVHAFTNPKADEAHIPGVAYNAKADKQSWKEFETFLKEVAPVK